MLVIGLTGGIASGKSTISRFFQDLGVPVIDSDATGHRAYEPGTDTFRAVVETFGPDVVSPEGTIDRKALGGKVFGNTEALQRLSGIVWPAIRRMNGEQKDAAEAEGHRVLVIEAAVMIEAGWADTVDEVWVVIVDPEIAVGRIKERNGLDDEAAWARVQSQLSNEERVAYAHVVIENNGTLEELQERFRAAYDDLQARLGAAAGR